ncbi:MAG: glycosyltransferase family 39 protein [Planctomycetaceae bacterium]
MSSLEGAGTPPARGWSSRHIAFAVAIVASQILFGVLYAQIPPCPDQSELDYTGWRALHGARPYVDFVSMNWPGAHWMHMTAIATFGNTIHAWRTADYLLMLAALAATAALLRKTFGTTSAVLALVAYPILFYAGQWLSGQRDFVCAHLVLIAFYFHWKSDETNRLWWQIPAGLCIAAATLIKPTFLAAIFVLPLHGWLIGCETRANWRRQLPRSAMLVGTTIAGLFTAFALLRVEGTPFGRFWDAAIATVTEAYSARELPLAELFSRFGLWMTNPRWWITGFAIVSPIILFGKYGSKDRRAASM